MRTLSVTFGSVTISFDNHIDGFTFTGDVKWGTPELSDGFKRWLRRGKPREGYPYGEWHDPVTHTFPVLATADVADLDAVLRPGATLTATDGSTTRTALVLDVDRDEPAFYDDGSAQVDYKVTTRYWRGAWTTYSATDPTTWGAVVYPGAIGGDAPALTEHRLVSKGATSLMALSVLPDADAALAPYDATGGSGAAGTGSTYASIWNPTFDPTQYGGDSLALVRAKLGTSVASSFRADSTATGSGELSAVEATPYAGDPVAGTSDATYGVLPFGPLPIPPVDMPYAGDEGTAWEDETITINQLSGIGLAHGTQTQTFTITKDRLTRIAVKVAVDEPDTYLTLTVKRSGIAVYQSAPLLAWASGWWEFVSINLATTPTEVLSFELAYSGNEADTSIYYSSSDVYAGGARTGGGDLCFTVYEQDARVIGVGVDILANAASAATATIHSLTLAPVWAGGVLLQAAKAADCGFLADCTREDPTAGGRLYDYKDTGSADGVGAVMDAEWMGAGHVRLPPGNPAVILAGGQTTNGTTVGLRYSCRYATRHLRPFGGL